MFSFFFFLLSPASSSQEKKNWFHLRPSQKVESKFEKPKSTQVTFIEIWFSFGWLYHVPQKHMCC